MVIEFVLEQIHRLCTNYFPMQAVPFVNDSVRKEILEHLGVTAGFEKFVIIGNAVTVFNNKGFSSRLIIYTLHNLICLHYVSPFPPEF